MAPPRKRRRLLLSDGAPPSPSTDLIAFEPQPTHIHSVSDLDYTRTVPSHIEEIHVQIQHQAVAMQSNHLQPRQIIESIVSALDLTASSTPSSSIPSSKPTHKSGAHVSSSRPPTLASSSAFPTLSISSGSRNGTAGHRTTSSTLPITYLATLTNHNVKTITRSLDPYVTTFGDGQVSTICNRFGYCKMETASESTTPFLSQPTQDPGTSSPVAFATATPSTTAPVPSSSSTGASSHHHSTTTAAPPPATIAGGAVGGIAGVAFLVLLAVIFVRIYRRKAQRRHVALPASDGMGYGGSSGMIDRTGLTSLAAVLPPLFRHQNRSQEPPPSNEQGFTKVSGRKLPSVWSEGMTRDDLVRSTPPTKPLYHQQHSTPNHISRSSDEVYNFDGHDEEYRGTGSISPDPSPFADGQGSPVSMTLSPGPQRIPTFHHPHYAPRPQRQSIKPRMPSPQPPSTRSPSPSTIGDRNSRLTEDV